MFDHVASIYTILFYKYVFVIIFPRDVVTKGQLLIHKMQAYMTPHDT